MNSESQESKPPNRYHHGDLHAALVKAGLEAVRKDGVEGLSLRAVARIAGVSRTAPYAHFADKDALITAIRAEAQREFGELMQRQNLGSVEGYEPLYAMARAYVNFACEEPALFKLITGPDAPMRSTPASGAPVYVDGIAVMFSAVVKALGGGTMTPRAMTKAFAGLALARGIAQLLIDGHIAPAMLGLKERDQLVTLLCSQLAPELPAKNP